MIQIKLTSVFVDDQEKALQFYTSVLGFTVKHDIPVGEDRWLTVVSPAAPDAIELLLEPSGNPVATSYQRAIYEQGLPATAFATDDIQQEYRRMKALGVRFTTEPTPAGPTTVAVFDDTCGNLIQLYQL